MYERSTPMDLQYSEIANGIVPRQEFEAARPTHRRISHIALIGSYVPRRCGIATFTADIFNSLTSQYPGIKVDVWAMNDGSCTYDYPTEVNGAIEQNDPISYRLSAAAISANKPDLVWLQHEFGIFGGPAGCHVLKLLDRIAVPVAVTMHSVLGNPDRDQRRVTEALIERCDIVMVMAEAAKQILINTYKCDPAKICVIPHGVPDRPFAATAPMKEQLGWKNRKVILTFGLLSPGKGIETVIAAMPAVVRRFPEAVYVILGATHPHCMSQNGEQYRDSLKALADKIGVAKHIEWNDGFCDTNKLLDYLSAADIYATPYLNAAQVTSGTLAYAVGLGKPVVSTPYIHAAELLGGGHGRLINFGDSKGFAEAIIELLEDEVGLIDLRKRTYALGRNMIWPRFAEAVMGRFEAGIRKSATPTTPIRPVPIPKSLPFEAVIRQSDLTGILQHSRFSIPDRRHGYCIDDNARALILACRCNADIVQRDRWMAVYASFVDHAWNPNTCRFRNFMDFSGQWLEDSGSNDSNGRAIWALGVAAASAPTEGVRDWARNLFGDVIDHLAGVDSPRAKAFKILGSVAMQSSLPDHRELLSYIADWGEVLMRLYRDIQRDDWRWFEPVLAYDNARIPEALIRSGILLRREEFVQVGLESLAWLNAIQTSSKGVFSAIGSDSFNRPFAHPLPHDQQPVEAAAMVDACDAAFIATGEPVWQDRTLNAYRWFLGKNEHGLAVGNIETGACFDALTPTGVNLNQGAESVLAFQLATVAIQPHVRR